MACHVFLLCLLGLAQNTEYNFPKVKLTDCIIPLRHDYRTVSYCTQHHPPKLLPFVRTCLGLGPENTASITESLCPLNEAAPF